MPMGQRGQAEAGVVEHKNSIGVGKIEEGELVGDLVILGFCRKQRLPYEQLKSIFQAAGLEENQLPNRRATVDAFRLATSTLKNEILATRSHGILKILVRDWKGGKTPRKDLTLEKQNSYRDRFEYTSPAVCIYYDADKEEMIWDNRLSLDTEREAYYKMEALLAEAYEEFKRRRQLIDGDAIYYALQDVINSTAPLPVGAGSFVIWKEHKAVVNALKSVITALNQFNVDEADRSSIHIFSVVNNETERESITTALEEQVERETREGLERMGRIMRHPENLYQYQGEQELKNYEKLKRLADEYTLRFRQERSRVDAQLEMLWKQHEQLMVAVAQNTARKALERARKEGQNNAVV